MGINHAVLAVAYGKEGSKAYYTIRNSWGASWGESGYIRLAYGESTCGITQCISAFIRAGNAPPTPPTPSPMPTPTPTPSTPCTFSDCGGCNGFCQGHGGYNCRSGSSGMHCKCGDGAFCDGTSLFSSTLV